MQRLDAFDIFETVLFSDCQKTRQQYPIVGSHQIKTWGKLGKKGRESCETSIGSDQEFGTTLIIGWKKAFSASISDHSRATKCTVGWNKIPWEVLLDTLCTFKSVYSAQCPGKSSKG